MPGSLESGSTNTSDALAGCLRGGSAKSLSGDNPPCTEDFQLVTEHQAFCYRPSQGSVRSTALRGLVVPK